MASPRVISRTSNTLLRALDSPSTPRTLLTSHSVSSAGRAKAFFHNARRCAQSGSGGSSTSEGGSTRPQRYGRGNQPPPHLRGEAEAEAQGVDKEGSEGKREEKQVVEEEEDEEDGEVQGGQKDGGTQTQGQAQDQASEKSETPGEEHVATKASSDTVPGSNAIALPAPSAETTQASSQTPSSSGSSSTTSTADKHPILDRVLDIETPSQAEESKPPHLQAPPYVHHFDSFTLVKDLQKGGFSDEQAVNVMKGIRGLLAENMDLARRALVSKSNVENESYLFRAACSELKTEIQNNRKKEADTWRSQRAQLQHEVEIVGQSMTQDIAVVRDELKGLFDDRKMAVRMEQKTMESKIQELNYKIAVSLNSEARGTVEGIRWVLTRRAATALAILGVMVLGTLNYSRYLAASAESERKRAEQQITAAEEVEVNARRGATNGLTEEILLAPEGVTGG